MFGDERRGVAAFNMPCNEIHRRRAQELGHEPRGRFAVDGQRRSHLLQFARPQQGDTVPQGHRLGLIVGDEDHRSAEFALKTLDLASKLDPKREVQLGERLVQEQDFRAPD